MVAEEYIEQGFPIRSVLQLVGLAKSSYYYKAKDTKPGKRVAEYVCKTDSSIHSISKVVGDIEGLLNQEFVDYGYYKTYIYLTRTLSYCIGSSRVYQLMKRNNLLKFQRADKKRNLRNWVKDLVPNPTTEFSFLEFDIKYMYVAGKRSNVQVLTILDVYSRWNLGHYINWSIKSQDVIALFDAIFKEYDMPQKFIVRNDNGSQFEADIVQQYLRNKGITQEFTKPATPQQNAHIESYHSIVESAVCRRMEFEDLTDVKTKMNNFKDFYNYERIHGGIGYISPYKLLLQKGTDMKASSIEKSNVFFQFKNN
jgi:putative transposase